MVLVHPEIDGLSVFAQPLTYKRYVSKPLQDLNLFITRSSGQVHRPRVSYSNKFNLSKSILSDEELLCVS
jgi:hypothetical protein